jgi:hypothetical protein
MEEIVIKEVPKTLKKSYLGGGKGGPSGKFNFIQ